MNANKLKRSSNQRGAVLLTVLTVACFAAILLTAVLTFVRRAHTNAYNNYNSEQAYYIASSTLLTINDYLQDPANQQEILSLVGKGDGIVSFTAASGDIQVGDFVPGGNCTVKVSEMGTAFIKITVKATCNGQEEIINAYYSKIPGSTPSGIDNALYCDSDASFSLAAGSTGAITSRNDVVVGNQCRSAGSIITGGHYSSAVSIDWKGDANDKASSYIIVNKNMYIRNSGNNFKPIGSKGFDPVVDDNNNTQFISIGGAFSLAGNSFQVGADSKHQMDIYCNAAYLGGIKSSGPYTYYDSNSAYEGGSQGEMTMYGNFYCYKQDTPDPANNHDGDFIVSDQTSKLDLTGNLFIEGNFIHGFPNDGSNLSVKAHYDTTNGQYVGGILYVSPSTQLINNGSSTSNRGIICNAISGADINDVKTWINNGALKIRRNPNDDSSFLTAGELSTMDPSALSNYVQDIPVTRGATGTRNCKPSVDFADYEKTYETTEDFVANTRVSNAQFNSSYVEAQSKNIEDFKLSTPMNDSDLSLNFNYYVTDNCYLENMSGQNVLIDLDQFTSDYAVIYLKMYVNPWWPEGSGTTLQNCNIIIKNGERNEKGDWVRKPTKFLYFIMENTGSAGKVNIENTKISDYYTYKYVVSNVNNRGINLSSYADANTSEQMNFENNSSGYTFQGAGSYGIYTPALSRYYLMLNSNDTLSIRNQNFIEAIAYLPGGTIDAEGAQGLSGVKLLKNINSNDMETLAPQGDTGMLFLGAMVCKSFKGHQTFGVSYVPQAEGSGVGGNGSIATTTIEFSHYESR